MRWTLIAAAACLLAPAALAAQQMQHMEEQIHQHLFAPEVVMQHQEELQITAEQRATISELIRGLQHAVVDLQWELQAGNRRLLELVEADRINADSAIAQFERVLAVEQRVKTLHFQTLIRLKSALTAEQREAMDRILQRMQHMRQRMMPGQEGGMIMHQGATVMHQGGTVMHQGGMMHQGGTVMHREER